MATESDQLKRDIEQTRRELSQDVDALTEKVTPARVVQRRVDRTKNAVGNIRERVMGPVTERFSGQGTTVYGSSGPGAGERASEALSSAKSSVAGTASDASDAALGAVGTARAKAEGNPLAAGLIAFGVGWLVSSLLPSSEREQQAAARVKDVASEHAGPVQESSRRRPGRCRRRCGSRPSRPSRQSSPPRPTPPPRSRTRPRPPPPT